MKSQFRVLAIMLSNLAFNTYVILHGGENITNLVNSTHFLSQVVSLVCSKEREF